MPAIEHRHLRSALEFAVLIAAEGQKRRPALPFPKELKPLLSQRRLPGSSLGRVRRAVEGDPSFRQAICAGALPELVDDVGRLWLAGSEGWEVEAAAIIAERDAEAASSDLRRDLKRAQKRRAAAEQAAARIQVELLHRDATIAEQAAELDDLRAEVLKANDEIGELRAGLIDSRNELRHARDREAAAARRAEAATAGAGRPQEPAPASVQPDNAELVDREVAIAAERRLAEVIEASREFVDSLESILAADATERASSRPEPPRRVPIGLPGGVISTSAVAAGHLVEAGAPILVDGYNVAKLVWPDRTLEQQRDALIDRTENLARRHGASITVVFDGTSVVGAHAPRRRSVRVVFSPEGTTADDVIRAEVANLPAQQPVVVVTSDREIVEDVRAHGANVVPSNAFIAVL